MRASNSGNVAMGLGVALLWTLGCSLFEAISPAAVDTPSDIPEPAVKSVPAATQAVSHAIAPSSPSSTGVYVYDVVSEDTAPEGRAPYGDSYNINRLERPFTREMVYMPYLDIVTFAVAKDSTWWYVTVRMVGQQTASQSPFHYGVELDLDHDGFGDYLITAETPITPDWDTSGVHIFADNNHDTSGISAETSDAPLNTDGYETQIFNGGLGDADPDLAWVRTVGGDRPTIQFAFKRSWSGSQFMLGVVVDAGPQDPGKMDYVDHFTLQEAGSPVRDNSNYPLKALAAVDNCCREAYGFQPTGYEPQLCPRPEATATAKPRPATDQPPTQGCPHVEVCPENSTWADYPDCYCTPY